MSGGGTSTCGTIFKLTPAGALTTLRSFNCANGVNPYAGLIQGTDGNFYGTTYGGGAKVGGTVFKITAGGKLTTLYAFCQQTNCADGSNPSGGLIQSYQRRLLRDDYFRRGRRPRHGVQRGHGAEPVRRNAAYVRQGRSGGYYSGQQFNRHKQRYV